MEYLPCPAIKVPTAVNLDVVESPSEKFAEFERLTSLPEVVIVVQAPPFLLNCNLLVMLVVAVPTLATSNLILKLVLRGML